MTNKDKLLKDRRVSIRVAGSKVLARVVKWVKPKPRVFKGKGRGKRKPKNWHRIRRAKSKAGRVAHGRQQGWRR